MQSQINYPKTLNFEIAQTEHLPVGMSLLLTLQL